MVYRVLPKASSLRNTVPYRVCSRAEHHVFSNHCTEEQMIFVKVLLLLCFTCQIGGQNFYGPHPLGRRFAKLRVGGHSSCVLGRNIPWILRGSLPTVSAHICIAGRRGARQVRSHPAACHRSKGRSPAQLPETAGRGVSDGAKYR